MKLELTFDTTAEALGALAVAEGEFDLNGRTVLLSVPLGMTSTDFEQSLKEVGVRAKISRIIYV